MFNKVIFYFMSCFLIIGSSIFPLGDFPLMRDIPGMYRDYEKVTTPDELGVIDFIGDYLLHGKDLFGHNKQDKQQDGNNNVQFQHQANPLSFDFFLNDSLPLSTGYDILEKLPFFIQQFRDSGYRDGLLRLPLT